jgi:hypothetical protein
MPEFDPYEISRTVGRIESKLDGVADDITEIKEAHKASVAALEVKIAENAKNIGINEKMIAKGTGFGAGIGMLLGFLLTSIPTIWTWICNHIGAA